MLNEVRALLLSFSGVWMDLWTNHYVNVSISERRLTDGNTVFQIDYGNWLAVEGDPVTESVSVYLDEPGYTLVYSMQADCHSYSKARLVCTNLDSLRVLLNAGTFSYLKRPEAV